MSILLCIKLCSLNSNNHCSTLSFSSWSSGGIPGPQESPGEGPDVETEREREREREKERDCQGTPPPFSFPLSSALSFPSTISSPVSYICPLSPLPSRLLSLLLSASCFSVLSPLLFRLLSSSHHSFTTKVVCLHFLSSHTMRPYCFPFLHSIQLPLSHSETLQVTIIIQLLANSMNYLVIYPCSTEWTLDTVDKGRGEECLWRMLTLLGPAVNLHVPVSWPLPPVCCWLETIRLELSNLFI